MRFMATSKELQQPSADTLFSIRPLGVSSISSDAHGFGCLSSSADRLHEPSGLRSPVEPPSRPLRADTFTARRPFRRRRKVKRLLDTRPLPDRVEPDGRDGSPKRDRFSRDAVGRLRLLEPVVELEPLAGAVVASQRGGARKRTRLRQAQRLLGVLYVRAVE